MLTHLMPVLPASDLARARAFYHDRLGLDPDMEADGMLMYHSADAGFEIYETPNAGTAKNTQMCWTTDDLDAEMARMRANGIVFEDYDVPGLKTVDGIATMEDGSRSAWFRDSEGNFLCVAQMTG